MPRSRSAWLSRYLSYGEYCCGHDEIRHMRSLDDVRAWLSQPMSGSCETSLAPFWRLIPKGMKIVTVTRSVDEVLASLRRGGLVFDDTVMRAVMQHLEAKLRQIARRLPDVLAVTFDDLATEDGCRRVWEHCLPYPWDAAWWQHWHGINIQISLPLLMRYMAAHRPQLDKLAKVAKHRIIAGMQSHRSEIDGVTFQVEPFDVFYRDAQHLFHEHLVQTEQSPDDHALKNLPLAKAMDDLGLLQILTARSRNGLMHGYLMTIVAPTLDAPDVLEGWHTIFFASPDIRGLGMKLQREALERLKQRGVTGVIARAGHRGSGPRLGTFYRRLGMSDFGQLYRLELGG